MGAREVNGPDVFGKPNTIFSWLMLYPSNLQVGIEFIRT